MSWKRGSFEELLKCSLRAPKAIHTIWCELSGRERMVPSHNPNRQNPAASELKTMPSSLSKSVDWRLLVPGLLQTHWQQSERGMVYLLSFSTALAMGILCWGSLLGWCFLLFSFASHVAASLDVLGQRSFPVFHRNVALAAAILGIGLTVYAPLGVVLASFALPAFSDGTAGVGYLVNRRAYQDQRPAPGHCVWMRVSPGSNPRAGQVVAVGGQEVSWTGRRWQVDGKDLDSVPLGSLPYFPHAWRFLVPHDHVLVQRESTITDVEPGASLVIVSQEQIVGRAWARYYPVWDRCLL
jgi:hypothetical protein